MPTELQMKEIDAARERLQKLVENAGAGVDVDCGVVIVAEPPKTLVERKIEYLVQQAKHGMCLDANGFKSVDVALHTVMRNSLASLEMLEAFQQIEAGFVRFSQSHLEEWGYFFLEDAEAMNSILNKLAECLSDSMHSMIGYVTVIEGRDPD